MAEYLRLPTHAADDVFDGDVFDFQRTGAEPHSSAPELQLG